MILWNAINTGTALFTTIQAVKYTLNYTYLRILTSHKTMKSKSENS